MGRGRWGLEEVDTTESLTHTHTHTAYVQGKKNSM